MNNISGYDISRMANFVTSRGEENSYAYRVAPKFSPYKIPNNYYQSMLCRRLLLPQPSIQLVCVVLILLSINMEYMHHHVYLAEIKNKPVQTLNTL